MADRSAKKSIKKHASSKPSGSSSGGPSSKPASSTGLPKSVRNAPEDMRPAIRRKQNSEAAKRSRDRQKEEVRAIQERVKTDNAKMDQIEVRLQKIQDTLEKRDKKKKQVAARRLAAKGNSSAPSSLGSGSSWCHGGASSSSVKMLGDPF